MSKGQAGVVDSQLNIFFDVRIPRLEPGQNKDLRLARQIRSHLKIADYMICPDGQIIMARARDMSTKAFILNVETHHVDVAKYINHHSKSKVEVVDVPLGKVCTIPIIPYHKNDWRDGRFGIVCSGGFVTHLVRLDGKYASMTVAKSAQAAYKLLIG